jgi:hypothetical protein
MLAATPYYMEFFLFSLRLKSAFDLGIYIARLRMLRGTNAE